MSEGAVWRAARWRVFEPRRHLDALGPLGFSTAWKWSRHEFESGVVGANDLALKFRAMDTAGDALEGI